MSRAVFMSLALLSLAAGPALAHDGHVAGGDFASGLLHPVGGADHLLAMLAVGLYAAVRGGARGCGCRLAFWAG